MSGILVVFILVCLVGCKDTEREAALKALDSEIESFEYYANKVEERAMSLKISCLCEESDSARWERAHEVVDIYRHFNLDSMSRYIGIERKTATDKRQSLLSQFDDIYETAFRGNGRKAAAEYYSIDTSELSKSEIIEYLSLGVEIFKHDSGASDRLETIRKQLSEKDTVSYSGIKNLATICRQNGDYEKALHYFERHLNGSKDSEDASSIYYNMAAIHSLMGNHEESIQFLAKSAREDIRIAHRDMQSLYQLALILLEDRDFKRATRYIDCHYKNTADGFFYPRLSSSGRAISRISSEYIETQKKVRWLISLSAVVLSVFVLLILFLFYNSRRKGRYLQITNEELKTTKEKLAITNRIKESYVSRYMMLSRKYLGEVSGQRLEFKRMLKEDGPEELFRRLKQVDYEYESEKEFYRIFDEAFLGIFPDFIRQVNSLIAPEAAYDETARTLPTEIRILAVIRLGITANPDIAEFLNCSINTVYTYRGKIKKLSLIGKNSIEETIARFDS